MAAGGNFRSYFLLKSSPGRYFYRGCFFGELGCSRSLGATY